HHPFHTELFFCIYMTVMPVDPRYRFNAIDRLLLMTYQETRFPVLNQFRHSTPVISDHRRAAQHRLRYTQPERFFKIDRVQQRPCPAQHPAPLGSAYRSCKYDLPPVYKRLYLFLVIGLILDDPRDHQPLISGQRYLDSVESALVRMDPPEVQ